MIQSVTNLKTKSLIYLSGGCGILAFMIAVLIFPCHYKLRRIDADIEKKKKYLEEQTLLVPHFQKIRQIKRDIKGAQDEAQSDGGRELPLPDKKSLSLKEAEGAFSLFREIALENQFQIGSVESDKAVSTDYPGYRIATLKLKGDFLHFYNFLIQLNQIPYVEHIEQIRIRTVRDAKEIYLKMWIAIQ